MRWSCLQFNVLLLPESYRRLPAETRWKPLFPPPLHGQGATLKTILINSKRITAKPAREGFVSMCACKEPIRTGIGAVCVEYGRRKWPITMLNHRDKHPWYRKMILIFLFGTLRSFDTLGRGFFACRQKRPRSVRSLSLASL